MGILDSLVYGIVQGATEFLPVSSSAHLALLPYTLKLKDPGVSFDLMMHVGTALAVIVYFAKDLYSQFKHLIPALFKWKKQYTEYFFLRNISLSLVTTFVVAMILKSWALSYGRNPILMGVNLIVFGFFMFWFDYSPIKKERNLHTSFAPVSAIIIGFFQALAIFPGVSRSGSTMMSARLLGVERKDSFHYSFILSLPVILGAATLQAKEMYDQYYMADGAFNLLNSILGVIIAMVVGLAVIHFFMKVITKIGLLPFFIYRFILGSFLLWYFG